MIRGHLMDLLERKINDPRLEMVTITDVVVTPDIVRANVHYSILGGAEAQAEAQAGLESAVRPPVAAAEHPTTGLSLRSLAGAW